MDIIDQESIDIFVVDSKEGLETIEDDFLELEKTQNNPSEELINKCFRAIHSVKGGAG